MTAIKFNVPHLVFSDDFEIHDNNKSVVIYGSNGMGKTSIYNAIKKIHNEYDYIDYSDMKNGFISGKGKEINITPYVQQHSKLIEERSNVEKLLDVSDSLKRFDLNSAAKIKENAPRLVEIQKSKIVKNAITITELKHEMISKFSDADVKFLSKNIIELSKIQDIEEDINILKNEYMKNMLKHLDTVLTDDIVICPVCDSEVLNLKSIIKMKLQTSKMIKTKVLNEFKIKNSSSKDEDIIERFNQLLKISKEVSDKDVDDYILFPNFARIGDLNKDIKKNHALNKKIKSLEIKVGEAYNNLKNIQNEFTKYIKNKFGADTIFSDTDYAVKVKLERHPSEYSTGEFNLILFAAKIYEFVGSEKKLMVLDDPISSYDIVNQYKIAFDIVSNNENGLKNFLIFTHNMSLINLINTQRRGFFDYRVIDKINNEIRIYDFKPFESDSIMSVYKIMNLAPDSLSKKIIELCMERDNFKTDESIKDKIHPLFHYDDSYSFNLTEHALYDKDLNNDYLASLVDDITFEKFKNKKYEELTIYKIVVVLALRVWIEKKLFNALQTDGSYLKQRLLSDKINYALPRNGRSRVINIYPQLTRTDLISRKVMLNQHEHFMSQGEPFNYVLNLSVDDIYIEISEIKKLFEK